MGEQGSLVGMIKAGGLIKRGAPIKWLCHLIKRKALINYLADYSLDIIIGKIPSFHCL